MAHFVPGVLSIRDPSTGLALSTGLSVKSIAKAGERVKVMSSDASSEYSDPLVYYYGLCTHGRIMVS
jgi:hypothetical protein